MQPGPHDLIKRERRVVYTPPFQDFGDFLTRSARRLEKKAAIVFEDLDNGSTSTISYAQLDRATNALAVLFREKYRLRQGDRISYVFPNAPQVILVNFAAWRSGLVTVPLDVNRDTEELISYKLSLTHAKLLFHPDTAELRLVSRRLSQSLPGVVIARLPKLQDLMEFPTPSGSMPGSGKPDKDCLILFTSGTTARPKGVRLTLKNLFANAASIAGWMRFNQKERFHILLPLYHINSITFTNTTVLVGGTVILSSRYSKSNFWKVMAKHKATGASIVPTIAYDLLSETASFARERKQLGSVRRIQIGSAPVQPNVVEVFMRAYGIPLIQGYGQTETSLRSTGVPMDLSPNQFRKIVRLNSLGTELATTNATVLDNRGREVNEGEVGEICVRGPAIMEGYLDDPEATREAFAFGWFHSGDTGYWREISGRRFFFLTGRTKEIIKKGGVLISPLAVEAALLEAYPSLREVYAVGFPDPRLGEEIGIIIVSQEDSVLAKILSDASSGTIRRLRPYEYPRAAIKVKDQRLPKTSTGKVQRVNLKRTFGSRLLESYRTVADTGTLLLRLIGPEEKGLMKQALAINNRRWGKHLTSSLTEFGQRATNGILLAALDRKGYVAGTISVIRVNRRDLQAIGKPGHWANTWDRVTADGTLASNNPKGDSLLCVAISVDNKKPRQRGLSPEEQEQSLKTLTPSSLNRYLLSDLDPVIRFHRRPKGGYARGARLVTVIPKGRIKDRDALGYSLLMHYPKLVKQPTLTAGAGIGTQLIEAALIWAWNARLADVFVYTRPSHLFRHFKA